MIALIARVLIRTAALLVPRPMRARWREEWLAEIAAAPSSGVATLTTLTRAAGAPWDAVTSRWTTRDGETRDRVRWLVTAAELKHAVRSLRGARWYALTCAGVLGLSMALATTVFAMVDGMLFKPLPYGRADRVFGIAAGYSKVPDTVQSAGTVTQFDIDAWRAALPEVTFTAFRSFGATLLLGEDEHLPSASVDANFFDVAGLKPMIGGFASSDFGSAEKVQPALLSYACWTRRFGGDLGIVGRSFIGETGVGFRVVGVLPEEFVFPDASPVDALTPLIRQASPSRGSSLHVIARLPEGLTEVTASARLFAAAKQLASEWPLSPPRANPTERQRLMSGHLDFAQFRPIRAALTERSGSTSWFRFWSALALVVLSVVNITGLSLARVQDRRRELALRTSLGARYSDLVRLLAVESAMVVGMATAAGIWAAHPMLAGMMNLVSKNVYFLKMPVIDLRVIGAVAATAAACVALITLVSARAASRWGRAAIAEGGTTTSRMGLGGRSVVGVQVALALVVATCGALVGGSLLRVTGESLGFDASRTGILKVYSAAPFGAADVEEMMARVGRLPGIQHIGGVNKPVLDLAFNGSEFEQPAGVARTTIVESMGMSADYLAAAGLGPVDGRLPTLAEFQSGAAVIVVSELVARQYWPGQRAVGQTLVSAGRTFNVVGVVPDARYVSRDLEPQGAIYSTLPAAARPNAFPNYTLVTFDTSGRASLGIVNAALGQVCPSCRIRSAQMLSDAANGTIKTRWLNGWIFSSFGVAAMVIVGSGILGLVAMTTNRRTREIGIRVALGATRPDVVRQVLGEQIAAVAAGLLAGGLVAGWAVRFVTALLYKTPIYDGWAWTFAALAILAVSLIGALVPSLRASRIDPVKALRAN